jgi:hypothetical protein
MFLRLCETIVIIGTMFKDLFINPFLSDVDGPTIPRTTHVDTHGISPEGPSMFPQRRVIPICLIAHLVHGLEHHFERLDTLLEIIAAQDTFLGG